MSRNKFSSPDLTNIDETLARYRKSQFTKNILPAGHRFKNILKDSQSMGMDIKNLEQLEQLNMPEQVEALIQNGLLTNKLCAEELGLVASSHSLPRYVHDHLYSITQSPSAKKLMDYDVEPSLNCYQLTSVSNSKLPKNYIQLAKLSYEFFKHHVKEKPFIFLVSAFTVLHKIDEAQPRKLLLKKLIFSQFGFDLSNKNCLAVFNDIQNYATQKPNREKYNKLRIKFIKTIAQLEPTEEQYLALFKVNSFIFSNGKISKSDLQNLKKYFQSGSELRSFLIYEVKQISNIISKFAINDGAMNMSIISRLNQCCDVLQINSHPIKQIDSLSEPAARVARSNLNATSFTTIFFTFLSFSIFFDDKKSFFQDNLPIVLIVNAIWNAFMIFEYYAQTPRPPKSNFEIEKPDQAVTNPTGTNLNETQGRQNL